MDTPAPTASHGVQELFAVEYAPMLRMAALIVGSASAAEDVVQDSFAVVSQRWESLERPGGYLRTTVVNGCRQLLRRRASHDRAVEELSKTPAVELPSHLLELRDALDRLNERQRLVVVLRYFVDIDDDEIASILGVKKSTVRSLAHRATSVLRDELQ